MSKREWDLTSENSRDAFAEWIRGRTNALLVLVIRQEDVSFAVDPQIAPTDAMMMVDVALPELAEKLEQKRQLARSLAEARKGF